MFKKEFQIIFLWEILQLILIIITMKNQIMVINYDKFVIMIKVGNFNK